ncbi:MAG: hypothetical protein KAT18_07445 [Candidatus Latescibacteria bacterium]|nr:hypothetical protein [Candidatus Latescibacterota bacterium]
MREQIIHTRLRGAALTTVVAVLIICASTPAQAQPPVPIRYSTRTLAMGSAGLLSSNPIEMGYFNPGALSLTGGFHIYIPMVQVNFNQDFIDLAEFIGDNEDSFNNFSSMGLLHQLDFINKVNNEVGHKWVGLDFDPMIGVQLGKLSLSAYSVSRAQVRFDADTNLNPMTGSYNPPTLTAKSEVDLVVNAAYGIQAGPLLHGGVGLRFLSRTHTEQVQTIDPLEGNNPFKLFDTATEEAEDTVTGFAFDVGGTLTLTKAIAVGGLVRGLVSSMEDADWEPEICAGVRLKPLEVLLGIPKILIRDITLEADIQDLANVRGEQYMDKLQLGAEVKIPFFALRAGMNRGKFAYGVGFHFLIVDLAVAKASVPVVTPTGVEDQDLFSLSVGIGF